MIHNILYFSSNEFLLYFNIFLYFILKIQMLERFALLLNLSNDKKYCQLLYLDDPLAIENRQIPASIEGHLNIGSWLKVHSDENCQKTWALLEDAPYKTEISADGKISLFLPTCFLQLPDLSPIGKYLDRPTKFEGQELYFQALFACGEVIQGIWTQNKKVNQNFLYNGKFEIQLKHDQYSVCRSEWILKDVSDEWNASINENQFMNFPIIDSNTCLQGRLLKTIGNLAIILGEDEKLVYSEFDKSNNIDISDFIEYKPIKINYNGKLITIGQKYVEQHKEGNSSTANQNNLLKRINSRDFFQIYLDAENWKLFEPEFKRIKGIGTLDCIPELYTKLTTTKTFPIFIKLAAHFFYEYNSVSWTVLEISNQSFLIEKNLEITVEKIIEKTDTNTSNIPTLSSIDCEMKSSAPLLVVPISPPLPLVASSSSIPRKDSSSIPYTEILKYVIECPHFFQHGFCDFKDNCKFSHGNENKTRGYNDAEKKLLAYNKIVTYSQSLQELSASNSTLHSFDTLVEEGKWHESKFVIYMCQKGNEAILMEFSRRKLIKNIFETKSISLVNHLNLSKTIDIGAWLEIDYKISNKANFARQVITVHNVRKIDGDFIRIRVFDKCVEFYTKIIESFGEEKNYFRTTLGKLVFPKETKINVGNSFWCRMSDTIIGNVVKCEKDVREVSILAHANAFTQDQMSMLFLKAEEHVGQKMIVIGTIYRCKFEEYFDEICKENTSENHLIMPGYTKNSSGHKGCPINRVLKGLFFSTYQRAENGQIPKVSPFGNIRMVINLNHLLWQPDDFNFYFADFYCNKLVGNQKHNIVLVLCKKGSKEDEFFGKHLIALNLWENPFFMAIKEGNNAIKFMVVCKNSDKINLFLAGSLKITSKFLKCSACHLEKINAIGNGKSAIDGLENNEKCEICNIDENISGSFDIPIVDEIPNQYEWELHCD